jgi:hypothetical protein
LFGWPNSNDFVGRRNVVGLALFMQANYAQIDTKLSYRIARTRFLRTILFYSTYTILCFCPRYTWRNGSELMAEI